MAGQKHEQAGAGGHGTVRRTEDFLALSQQILLCATNGRPDVELLIDMSDALVSFCGCRALELWLKDDDRCARWEATRTPKRLCRLGDVACEAVDALVAQGTVWTHDARQDGTFGNTGGDRSLARFVLQVREENTGLLILKSEEADFFSEAEVPLYEHIAKTVAVAVDYQRAHLAQRERVKELTCLYDVAQTAAQIDAGLEEILQGIVNRLPSAWQYPDITAARITLDNRTYASEDCAGGPHLQQAVITLEGKQRGVVEVIYKEDRPDLDEGPFLREERKLLEAVSREITLIIQRKKAEADRTMLQEQIRHADRLATIGQLAAGVAHELNEPLGGILGFAQLSSKEPDLSAQVAQDLAKIEGAALHAREVIRKLMLFARQTVPAKKHVDLNQVVHDGLYFLESRCAKAGIELTRVLQPELPPVTADPTQLHQVLVNLIVNAIQAMPSGGKLTVETGCHDNTVSVVVTDTGTGMSEEVQERIFEPFFTTKDISEGTGLGLPVVYGIVTSHGGRVEVQSGPGQGASFTIRLPLNQPADTLTETRDHERPDG